MRRTCGVLVAVTLVERGADGGAERRRVVVVDGELDLAQRLAVPLGLVADEQRVVDARLHAQEDDVRR